jgi:hypothetical protein
MLSDTAGEMLLFLTFQVLLVAELTILKQFLALRLDVVLEIP